MKNLKLAVLYGFLVWIIPFAAAFLIFPIRQSNRPLFESIMPVSGTFASILALYLYIKNAGAFSVKEGIKLGLLWMGISIAIDLLMFMQGPWKMTLSEYMSDIGVTYLAIPIITGGFGYLLEKK